MEKVERSMGLVSSSWSILKQNRSLLMLPVAMFVCQALFLGVMASLAVASGGLDHWAAILFKRSLSSLSDVTFLDVVLATTTWIGTTFIAVLFTSVLLAAVFESFEGRPARAGDGFRVIRPKMGNILRWAILAGGVTFVLNVMYRKGGIVGLVLAWMIDAVWAFASVFVIPVLVVKDVGPVDALFESARLLRKTWGEQLIGGFGIGLTFLGIWIAALAIIVVTALLGGPWAAVAIGVPLAAAILAMQSAIGTIFTAALYRWASDGTVASGFDSADFQGAYKQKEKK